MMVSVTQLTVEGHAGLSQCKNNDELYNINATCGTSTQLLMVGSFTLGVKSPRFKMSRYIPLRDTIPMELHNIMNNAPKNIQKFVFFLYDLAFFVK